MKGILLAIGVVAVLAGIILFFRWDIEVSSEKKHKVAIQGYDVVSYFTESSLVKGLDSIEYDWNELTWRFSTEEHQTMFAENPAKYAPEYGGNCAFTTALGKAQMGLAKHWVIIDRKLYLNSNLVAHFLWKSFPSMISKADKEWVKLIAEAAEAKKAHPQKN